MLANCEQNKIFGLVDYWVSRNRNLCSVCLQIATVKYNFPFATAIALNEKCDTKMHFLAI